MDNEFKLNEEIKDNEYEQFIGTKNIKITQPVNNIAIQDIQAWNDIATKFMDSNTGYPIVKPDYTGYKHYENTEFNNIDSKFYLNNGQNYLYFFSLAHKSYQKTLLIHPMDFCGRGQANAALEGAIYVAIKPNPKVFKEENNLVKTGDHITFLGDEFPVVGTFYAFKSKKNNIREEYLVLVNKYHMNEPRIQDQLFIIKKCNAILARKTNVILPFKELFTFGQYLSSLEHVIMFEAYNLSSIKRIPNEACIKCLTFRLKYPWCTGDSNFRVANNPRNLIYLDYSPIHGLGVFALLELPEKTAIAGAFGWILGVDDVADENFDINKHILISNSKDTDAIAYLSLKEETDSGSLIIRFTNSISPQNQVQISNCEWCFGCNSIEIKAIGWIVIRTKRNIKAGEEILDDYLVNGPDKPTKRTLDSKKQGIVTPFVVDLTETSSRKRKQYEPPKEQDQTDTELIDLSNPTELNPNLIKMVLTEVQKSINIDSMKNDFNKLNKDVKNINEQIKVYLFIIINNIIKLT